MSTVVWYTVYRTEEYSECSANIAQGAKGAAAEVCQSDCVETLFRCQDHYPADSGD